MLTTSPLNTVILSFLNAGGKPNAHSEFDGRSLLSPRVNGEQWNLGAVSTAEWTGVPLAEVLDRAGVKAGAREVVFRGADSGKLDACSESIHFERSLSMNDAAGTEA